ncbi:MAG TPA: GNAT family N-acetyltransferase [Pyrinomonadaceae bacterium]|jgi:ribosomal protein S18 acetylase RimI-like enzyme
MGETQNIERTDHVTAEVVYRVGPPLRNDELNMLSAAAWEEHTWSDFQPVLNRSLAYVCAYSGAILIGFVNLAWDGGEHAFVLDTLVHPEFRRRGIGRELVRRAVAEAGARGVKWVHVDFEPHLQGFYDGCGFRSTAAGLIRLR